MNSASTSVTRRSEPKRNPSFSMCLKISNAIFHTFAPITPARSASVRSPFLRHRVLTSAIVGRLLMMAMASGRCLRVSDDKSGAGHVRIGYGAGKRHRSLRGQGVREGVAVAGTAGKTRRTRGPVPPRDHGAGRLGDGEKLPARSPVDARGRRAGPCAGAARAGLHVLPG